MNKKSFVDIDREIGQLEKQLSALYTKRVAALEAEIATAQARIAAFGGAVSPSCVAPAAKAPAAQPGKRKGKPGRKPKQAAAPKVPTTRQVAAQAAPTEPAFGASAEPAPAPAPLKKKAARKAKPATTTKKRTRTPTAEVEKRILEVLKEAGLFGISQIAISKKTGLGYQTVVKKLKELPQVTKQGSGKEGRFLLKA